MGMLQLQAALSSFTTVVKKRIQKCTAGQCCMDAVLHSGSVSLPRLAEQEGASACCRVRSTWLYASGGQAAKQLVCLRRTSCSALHLPQARVHRCKPCDWLVQRRWCTSVDPCLSKWVMMVPLPVAGCSTTGLSSEDDKLLSSWSSSCKSLLVAYHAKGRQRS